MEECGADDGCGALGGGGQDVVPGKWKKGVRTLSQASGRRELGRCPRQVEEGSQDIVPGKWEEGVWTLSQASGRRESGHCLRQVAICYHEGVLHTGDNKGPGDPPDKLSHPLAYEYSPSTPPRWAVQAGLPDAAAAYIEACQREGGLLPGSTMHSGTFSSGGGGGAPHGRRGIGRHSSGVGRTAVSSSSGLGYSAAASFLGDDMLLLDSPKGTAGGLGAAAEYDSPIGGRRNRWRHYGPLLPRCLPYFSVEIS